MMVGMDWSDSEACRTGMKGVAMDVTGAKGVGMETTGGKGMGTDEWCAGEDVV